ncbi:phosphatase PAP2 family protein [soil metagenome]
MSEPAGEPISAAEPASEPISAAPEHERPAGLRWWKEVAYIAVFYVVYTFIRNQFGSEAGGADIAFDHARQVIDVERALGTYHEETVQELFLGSRPFIQFWNLYYGTFHFVITIAAILWLFLRQPGRYVRWRSTLAATTALALIGYATYPLAPPRLLPELGYVDTLRTYGGLWSFDDGAMEAVSNQYAAMPSLHFAWALWCSFVFFPAARRPWAKALVVAYPLATLFAIVVTANHFWLDAAGGALVLAGGWLAGSWWDRMRASTRRSPGDVAGAPS